MAVRTIHVKWGLTVQVGVAQSVEGDTPVVHLRALENDPNGEQPFDVVMSPAEALDLSARLAATAIEVRREIAQWQAETGGAR